MNSRINTKQYTSTTGWKTDLKRHSKWKIARMPITHRKTKAPIRSGSRSPPALEAVDEPIANRRNALRLATTRKLNTTGETGRPIHAHERQGTVLDLFAAAEEEVLAGVLVVDVLLDNASDATHPRKTWVCGRGDYDNLNWWLEELDP